MYLASSISSLPLCDSMTLLLNLGSLSKSAEILPTQLTTNTPEKSSLMICKNQKKTIASQKYIRIRTFDGLLSCALNISNSKYECNMHRKSATRFQNKKNWLKAFPQTCPLHACKKSSWDSSKTKVLGMDRTTLMNDLAKLYYFINLDFPEIS